MMNLYDFKIKTYSAFEKIAGESSVKSLFIRYYTLIAKRKGLHFIHIPKSAGTSICDIIYGRRIGHFSARDIIKVRGFDYFERLESFTVVRNPLDRLLSAYNFARFGGSMGAVKDQSFYQRDHRFSSFDAFVNEWLVEQELLHTQIIFRPQYTFVCDDDLALLPKKIFKIEHSKEINEFLSDILSQKISIKNLNNSKNQGDINISKDTISAVRKLYSKDFELFNY